MERTMSTHGPIEDATRGQMNAVAEVLAEMMAPGYGFTLLVFKLGTSDGRMNYISSAERGDMITAMKELIANFEGRVMEAPKGKQ